MDVVSILAVVDVSVAVVVSVVVDEVTILVTIVHCMVVLITNKEATRHTVVAMVTLVDTVPIVPIVLQDAVDLVEVAVAWLDAVVVVMFLLAVAVVVVLLLHVKLVDCKVIQATLIVLLVNFAVEACTWETTTRTPRTSIRKTPLQRNTLKATCTMVLTKHLLLLLVLPNKRPNKDSTNAFMEVDSTTPMTPNVTSVVTTECE